MIEIVQARSRPAAGLGGCGMTWLLLRAYYRGYSRLRLGFIGLWA